MKTIAIFNSRSRVGKSFLAYHLAWMFHHCGARVAVVDVDPQTHLTGAFIEDDQFEALTVTSPRQTILGAIEATISNDLSMHPHLVNIEELGILAGDPALAGLEGRFSRAWDECLRSDPEHNRASLRLTTAIHDVTRAVGRDWGADVVLLDLGPGLGAINRAALIAADAVVIPLATDMATRLALPDLGQTLRTWRDEWNERKALHSDDISLPSGRIDILGYIVTQAVSTSKPESAGSVAFRAHTIARVFHQELVGDAPPADSDPFCLASLRNLRGLMNFHLEARKPVFELKAADGAIGSYAFAVKDAYVAFEKLAREIAKRAGIPLPEKD